MKRAKPLAVTEADYRAKRLLGQLWRALLTAL